MSLEAPGKLTLFSGCKIRYEGPDLQSAQCLKLVPNSFRRVVSVFVPIEEASSSLFFLLACTAGADFAENGTVLVGSPIC